MASITFIVETSVSAPPDWLIDLGHSRIKWARGHAGRLVTDSSGACPVDELAELELALGGKTTARALVSGQSNPEVVDAVSSLLLKAGLSLHAVTTGHPSLPVLPAYAQLGVDRWLALQRPWLEQRHGLCVIDCGTAITVDLVDDRGRHRGGWIMAGLGSLRHGLLSRARGLPAPTSEPFDLDQPATASARAIASGTLLQAIGGIEQAVLRCEALLGRKLTPWLGGGDAGPIAAELRRPVTRADNLVLHGLALAGAAL